MDKNEVIIALYEIVTRKNRSGDTIRKKETDGFDEGFIQGATCERMFYEKQIKELIEKIK